MPLVRNTEWHTSSKSAGGNCLTARRWHTSTHSGGNGCVEAKHDGFVQVRDSKNPQSPILEFAPDAWTEFILRIQTGELVRP